MPNQGEKAPSFTLPDTERKQRSLQELLSPKGATILAFYPGAFTGVCTKELCTFRDSLNSLKSMNAQVIAASTDSPFANKAFVDQNNLNFPVLSDVTKEVSKRYAGLYEAFAGIPGYTAA